LSLQRRRLLLPVVGLIGRLGHQAPVAVPLATRWSGGGVDLDVDVARGDPRYATSGR